MDLIFPEKGIREIVIDYLVGSNLFWSWRNDAVLVEVINAVNFDVLNWSHGLFYSRLNPIYVSILPIFQQSGSYDSTYIPTQLSRMVYDYAGWCNPYYSTFEVETHTETDGEILLNRNKIWQRKVF